MWEGNLEGSAYEIAVYVLRYWFAALMVFLLFRLVRSVVRGWNEQPHAGSAPLPLNTPWACWKWWPRNWMRGAR